MSDATRRLSRLATWEITASTAFWVLLFGIPTALLLGLLVTPWFFLWTGLAAAVTIGCAAVYGHLLWRNTTYEVTADRFRLETGVFVRRRRTFARERIRAVDLTANPVQRILGLAAVQIGTAEQSGDDGSAVLSPLSRAEADRLHTELVPRDGDADEVTLAQFTPSWMRYAPLTWTPLVITLGSYAIAGQFAEGFGRVGWEWATGVADTTGWWLVILVIIGIPVLIGILGSFLVHAELWWNHRLERDRGVLRVTRGLLTRRTVSIPQDRLRGVRVTEPLGVRLAGAARVDALAIGLQNQNPEGGDDGKKRADTSVLLPFAPRPVVDRVAADVVHADTPPTDPARLTGHPIGAFHRRLVPVAWILAGWLVVTGVLAFLLLPRWWVAVPVGAVVLAAVGLVSARDRWRSLGHRLDDQHLVTRSGSLSRSTDALQRDAIIGWNVRQSSFQRRRRLLTLVATTGAGRGGCAVVDIGSDSGVALADAATPGLLTPFLEVTRGDEARRDDQVSTSVAPG
ncbi:PH domain-containing protein [Propionibacteriaceae bacterium Y2011]